MLRILSVSALTEALTLDDLTDAAAGPHALQALVADAAAALTTRWGARRLIYRGRQIVSVQENYDRLGYPPDGAARDARYSRYVDAGLLLRTHMSAVVPDALAEVRDALGDDALLVCPGMVWRRDAIDRLHVGTPHQLDVWRIARRPVGDADLLEMIGAVAAELLPGRAWRTVPAVHPYTHNGLEILIEDGDALVEIGECGLAGRHVLESAGLGDRGGLAMGLGLDRILMLRKGIPDIRLLRSTDARVRSQMRDLAPYRQVSAMPPVRRDLSLAVDAGCDAEALGDRIRDALGECAGSIEELAIISETAYLDLPPQAVSRMGMRPGQKNVLLRLVIRDYDRTLTDGEANSLRNRAYDAVHEGARREVAADAG
jgi:phenylalanyl-tRNA synthetase alpha chain